MKRIILWISALILLTISYFIIKNNIESEISFPEDIAIKAIEKNTPVFFKVLSLSGESNNMPRGFADSISCISTIKDQLSFFDSVFHFESDLKNHNIDLWIQLNNLNSKKIEPVFLFGFRNKTHLTEAFESINNKLENVGSINHRNYDGENLCVFQSEQDSLFSKFTFAAFNGILAISQNELLVEAAIRQAKKENSLLTDHDFISVLATASRNASINLYLNIEALALNIQKYSPLSSTVAYLGTWTEVDFHWIEKKLFVNGFLFDSSDKESVQNLYFEQESKRLQIKEGIPSTATLIHMWCINDPEKYIIQLEKERNEYGNQANFEFLNKKFRNLTKMSVPEWFSTFFDDEFALFYNGINTLNINNKLFFIALTQSRKKCNESLQNLLDQYKRSNEGFMDDIKKYSFDEHTSIEIYPFPFPDLFSEFFNFRLIKPQSNYFAFYNNYLIFGEDPDNMNQCIQELMLNNHLGKKSYFNDFTSNFSDRQNQMTFAQSSSAIPLIETFIPGDHPLLHNSLIEFSKKFQFFGLQIGSIKKPQMLSIDLSFGNDKNENDKPNTIWELGLDTNCISKPQIVKNHNDDKKEILIQDANNTLYLINYAGRILWKKQIDGQILGQVHQIDFYKNNKLQYLFNTSDRIYLLDRNSNPVDRFPVRLPAKATAPLGLADYDHTKEYRIFIPCSDRKVYLFNKTGKLVEGWNFGKTESEVLHEVQHFRIGTKDYIVFTDKQNIYFLNRRGEERIHLQKDLMPSKNNIIYSGKDQDGIDCFLGTQPDGSLFYIYQDGKCKVKKTGNFSDKHYFELIDINSDGKDDLIYLDKDTLSAFSNDRKLFATPLPEPEEQKPDVYIFPGNDVKIGLHASAKNNIYLINHDGSFYKDFPLIGNTAFSIASITGEGYFNLFTGTRNGFLYNYRIR